MHKILEFIQKMKFIFDENYKSGKINNYEYGIYKLDIILKKFRYHG